MFNRSTLRKSTVLLCLIAGLCLSLLPAASHAQAYLDNETIYPNQDPNTETRRSDHFRVCFGHYDSDGGMSETMAQGNLQMFENLWQRNIVELGLNDMGQSAILENRDGNEYRTNFLFLMTWNDGGGGGAYMSMDGMGYSFAMANPGYCRFDPPSGATPHEVGHCWEGQARGFNGSDSSGAWWECTADWFMLQLDNAYPGPGALLANSMYYCTHGRDYYDSWLIWEAAREDPRYGSAWVNTVWTNATPDQQAHEFIIERMARVDSSGSADKPGANRDLWGDAVKKAVTWDYQRQRWFASANSAEDGSDWGWYQRCRTPLVKMPGVTGWYRPERSHIPMEYGFNIIPLTASPNTTVTCNFQPQCDYLRQSDWRACLVAVSNNNDARYSSLWNKGANSIALSGDESKVYVVVIATPKPMSAWAWDAYRNDAGLQFPYAVSFTNATPRNVIYPVQSHTGMTQHPNGLGWKSNTATVDATAYIGPNAQVLDSAQVRGYARIEDYAVVRNSAQVRDYAVVSGHAMVQDSAAVYGNGKVRDWAQVFGNAQVYDNAKVIEHANVGDSGNVLYASAIAKGTTYLYSPSTLQGCVIVDGDTANGNGAPGNDGYVVADHGVHFGWQWGENPSIFSGLADNGYIYEQHTFERENTAFAWDEYGINQGFLMNGCRSAKDTVTPTRGGLVLPLDGVSQYVELHNSVNDFRETAITVWVKWTGSAPDQRIWSMGDGASKVMYLTPKDGTTGNLRFVISDGTTTQYLNGASPIPANTWTHVVVTFGSPLFNTSTKTWSATGTLYVNGTQVATLAGMIVPDALNAPLMENANYLGRGNAGNYLQGYVDDFRAYMKTLSASDVLAVYNTAAPAPVTITPDTTAPTPNAETWLVSPNAISDNAITMSATQGTDASNWVEYYFQCTSGGGHDSGWVSFNKYTDVGLTPGTAYTYTVKMRDKSGNMTAASTPAGATTQTSTAPAASFAYGPVGIANGQVTMTATKVTSPSGLVEYKFDRITPSAASSNWQASPTWTNTGLTTGVSCSYTVTVRDGRGNTSAASAPVTTTAKDMAAPKLMTLSAAHWGMMPYATIDNKVSMTATDASDPSGVQYYFHCTAGGAPDSSWQDSPTYVTPNALADGTYSYQYKLRDKSAQYNESGYSITYMATIKPTTGYHACTFAQLTTLPDDYLVTFNGIVIGVNTDNYIVRDPASSATVTVKPDTYGQATDATNLFKNVTVNGHLYTLSGARLVTYSHVTVTGTATQYTISGKVTNPSGVGIAGATVYFSTGPGAATNPICTATTDANGNYSRSIINGTWYVAVTAPDYYPSADQVVVVNGANVPNINFTLIAMPKISGKVTISDGTPMAGATVCFAQVPGATANPIFTVTTDANGNYSRGVNGSTTWYVAAKAPGYGPTPDTTLEVAGFDITNVNFVLTPGGDGLLGQYYDNTDFSSLMVTRIDPQINFDWGGVAPDPSMGVDNFSVRWTGQVKPKYSETYTFTTTSDDGVRLWVNNKLLVDNWNDHGATDNSGTVTLTAGTWYSIKMEFYQGGGGAVARLDWSSPSQARETIPQSCLWSVSQPTYTISGKVTDLSGTPISGASVYVSDTATGSPLIIVLTDSSGNYSQTMTNGTWYVSVGCAGYLPSASEPVIVNGAAVGNVNFALGAASAIERNIPRTNDLMFGCVTESFPATGPTGPWAALFPAGLTLSTIGSPTVETLGGIKWERNNYSDGDGYLQARYAAPIAVNGVTIIAAVRPIYAGVGGESRGEIVDIFYDRLALAISHNDGRVMVARNYWNDWGPAIPEGQNTILSLVVQTDGSYKVWANGVQIMTGGANGTWTSINPTHADWGDPDFTHYVTVGRNAPDGWSTYNGYLGDVFLYKVALTDGERLQVEGDIANKLAGSGRTYTVTASAALGGSITPNGYVTLLTGANQAFNIAPNAGYTVNDVVVDGVSRGAITSYTFNNVTADHTISVTFRAIPFTITASAGVGGTITPSGAVSVNYGNSQTFTIAAADGYSISTVMVDGVNNTAAVSSGTYTFSNVTANHTISASFVNALAIYYKFDETSGNTAADSSGNARNGTVTQGTTLGWAAGQMNNCLRFGTTSAQYAHYVTEPAITGTYTGFTMSMWVNPGGTATKYLYYEATAATGAVRLQISGTTSSRVFTLAVYNGSTAVNYAFNGVAVNSNAWSHVAFSYDNTTGVKQVKFYLNGVLQQTLTISTSLSAIFNSGIVYIGNQGTTTSNSFVGYLDDFRLYTAPLSASYIAGIYDSTIAHTITASAGPNGAISPTGPVTVNPGANQTFTITPSAGYAISDLKIDGASITPVISYTFSNVTANHTISATFAKPVGMNNRIALTESKVVGRAVRVWGKVKSVNGTTSFTISDGYGPTITVNVNAVTLPSGFDTTKTVIVTGTLSADKTVQAQAIRTYP